MRPIVKHYENAEAAKIMRREIGGFIVYVLRFAGPSEYIVCNHLHETAVNLAYFGESTYGKAFDWINRNMQYIQDENYIIRVSVFKSDMREVA